MEFFGVAPFDGLAAGQIAGLAAVYMTAFLIKGMVGFGAVPLMIVIGSFLVEPHDAVILAAITNVLTHSQYLPHAYRHGQRALVGRLALFVLPAIAVGVLLFARINGEGLSILSGAIILVSVLIDAFRLVEPLAPMLRRNPKVVGALFGIVTGMISGVVGAGSIAFLSLYIRMYAPDRQGFRATIILMTGVIILWRITVLAISGLITPTLLTESLMLLPGSVLAGYAGARMQGRLSDRNFFMAYRLVLAAGALLMIWRGAVA